MTWISNHHTIFLNLIETSVLPLKLIGILCFAHRHTEDKFTNFQDLNYSGANVYIKAVFLALSIPPFHIVH